MKQLSRRELLAWMAAGTATASTGWAISRDGRGASGRPTGNAPGTVAGPMSDSATAASAAAESVAESTGESTAPVAPAMGAQLAFPDDRVLIVIEMPGGNDGLSMVVPYGDGAYYDARPELALAAADVLAVDDRIGLHPNLAKISQLGAGIVLGVGDHQPDGSHFEMLQRWWRGDPEASGATSAATGWIGRLADVLANDDALATAITLGSGSHPIVRSNRAPTLAIPNADAAWYLAGAEDPVATAFQRGVRAFGSAGGDGFAGRLAATTANTAQLAERLVAIDAESPTYPDSQLGRSLAFARTLLALGAGVRVVHVAMEADFDTHEGHDYRHPELMTTLDEAVGAFWADVESLGIADRVLMMTTSEFGRTLRQNASVGLDHGTASSTLLLGPVDSGLYGEHPSLTALDDNGDQIASMGFDSYLASVVEGWLGVPASEVFDTSPEIVDLGIAG